jgi:serine/threonine protein kinase
MFNKRYKSYKLGTRHKLSNATLDSLIPFFKIKNHSNSKTVLAGRNPVIETTIPEFGAIVIKQYSRGGFISCFNKDKYFYSKKSRSELEFNALIRAEKAGVNVPEPIAYISRGSLFYNAWLITRKIEGSANYVELCLNQKETAISLLPAICEDINKLIASSIHHVDLHPGNIIIDKNNKPFILDFDKACYFAKDKSRLKDKYVKRWQRAIRKYQLPDELLNIQLL